MNEREIIEKILKRVKPTADLYDVTNIIDGGYLDSLELLGLITSLMEEFSVEIGIEDISPENFNSVKAMADLVKRLK